MTWLTRLLRRDRPSEVEPERGLYCSHAILSPRWDDPSDIGNEDKAIGFTGTAGGEELTPAEAHAVRSVASGRLGGGAG